MRQYRDMIWGVRGTGSHITLNSLQLQTHYLKLSVGVCLYGRL